MTLVHKHVLIRAEVNKPPKDPNWVKNWLAELVDKIGMKVLSGPHAEYVEVKGNAGVTGVVIIETSHIAIHVWDEPDPALIQMDLYSCAEFDPNVVFDELKQFDVVKLDYKYLDREHGLAEVDVNS